MDLKKVVLSHINNFSEVGLLKNILENLPKDYSPFPELNKEVKIGAMLFCKQVFLSPMLDRCGYEGIINIPDGSINAKAYPEKDTHGIVIGAEFNHKGRDFVLYRTDTKHRNP